MDHTCMVSPIQLRDQLGMVSLWQKDSLGTLFAA